MKLRDLFFCLSLFLLKAGSALFAQTRPAATDVVHLKSGQTHQGVIIEQKPGESIRLWRSVEGDTLTFGMDEIDRITKAVPSVNASMGTTTETKPAEPERRFNTNPLSVALQVSAGGGDYTTYGFGAIIQKRFPEDRAWSGIGLHYLSDQNLRGVNTMPIVLHTSYELTESRRQRLAALGFIDLGCAVNLSKDYFDEGLQTKVKYGNGWYFNTGLRFRVNVLKNAGIWLDLGYLFQNSKLRDVETDKKVGKKSWHVFQVKSAVYF